MIIYFVFSCDYRGGKWGIWLAYIYIACHNYIIANVFCLFKNFFLLATARTAACDRKAHTDKSCRTGNADAEYFVAAQAAVFCY